MYAIVLMTTDSGKVGQIKGFFPDYELKVITSVEELRAKNEAGRLYGTGGALLLWEFDPALSNAEERDRLSQARKQFDELGIPAVVMLPEEHVSRLGLFCKWQGWRICIIPKEYAGKEPWRDFCLQLEEEMMARRRELSAITGW